jgi:hypothetical protein
MTQYSDLVAKARNKLKVEKWASSIKSIYGQRTKENDWVVTTTYNNNDKIVENVSKKTKTIYKSGMSLEDMLDAMQVEEADVINRL